MITKNDDIGLTKLIRTRLADYTIDVSAERAKLVEAWRQHHPEAAKEGSNAVRRLDLMSVREPNEPACEPDEIWFNDIYNVTLRRKPDTVFGTRDGMIQLGINAHDGTSRHDWREFQAIKNQLAGEECEAFELYPAESRLMDPSNYYSLWCFPGLKRIRVGSNEERRVYDAHEALAPQRALPK